MPCAEITSLSIFVARTKQSDRGATRTPKPRHRQVLKMKVISLGWRYKRQLRQANLTHAGDPAVSRTALEIVAAGVQERETRRCESGRRDQHGRDGRQDDKCHCANALQDITATQELRTVEHRIALF